MGSLYALIRLPAGIVIRSDLADWRGPDLMPLNSMISAQDPMAGDPLVEIRQQAIGLHQVSLQTLKSAREPSTDLEQTPCKQAGQLR